MSRVPASYFSYHPTAGALPHQPRRPPELPLFYPLHHYTTYSALLAILPLAPACARLANLYSQVLDNALNTWALQPELNQVTARSREHQARIRLQQRADTIGLPDIFCDEREGCSGERVREDVGMSGLGYGWESDKGRGPGKAELASLRSR